MAAPIKISTLFKIPLREFNRLKRNVDVLFEDGKVIENCNFKYLILFRYLFDFVTEDPDLRVSLTSDLYIRNHLEEGYFNADTYLSMYSVYYRKLVEEKVKPNGNDVSLIPRLMKKYYESINKITKDLSHVLDDYIFGVEIEQVLKVQMNAELLESMVEVKKAPSQEKILHTYDVLDDIIRHKLGQDDIIRLIYLSGMVSKNQLRQLFGSRGYLTEINSTIFKIPMYRSFTLGAASMYDLIIESRAGAKALYLSNSSIQESEAMAKEIQLATMYVERIDYGDCGNKEYMIINNVEPGDIKNLLGKHVFLENGTEVVITPENAKEFIGKPIRLRAAHKCKLRDKKKICIACFGETGYSIYPHENFGHKTTINVTHPITQSILSTKHLTMSASDAGVRLNQLAEKYFTTKGNKVFLRKNIVDRKTITTYMKIPQYQISGIVLLDDLRSVSNINITRMSRVIELILEEVDKKGNTIDLSAIPMKNGTRAGYFSPFFWNYILKHGYSTDDMDNIVVDLSNYDYKQPIIEYPVSEFDFQSLNKQFKSLIKKRSYYKVSGRKVAEYSPDVLVMKIYELLNKRIAVHTSLIESIVYAFTGWDITNHDYDLGRNSPFVSLIGLEQAIGARSLGAIYGWTRLKSRLTNPHMHVEYGKPDHPLDVVLKPNEVVKFVKDRDGYF